MKKFFCLCFSPTIQKSISFKSVKLENVNRSEHYRIDASGKAVNSARVLAQLEKNCVSTYCPLGKNNYGIFEKLAKQDNLDLLYSLIPGNTRECWTLLDKTAGTTTELVVGEPVFKRTKDITFLEKTVSEIELPVRFEEYDAILLGGSRPGIWRDDLYPILAKAAIDKGKIFLADYHGEDLRKTLEVCIPTIIKINEEEFLETFYTQNDSKNITEINEKELKKLITAKSRELKNIIVITRGTKPTFAAQNGNFAECPIEKVKAVNTTACGDSFSAGFLYEYTNSGNFNEALKKGTWCAARNAESETPGSILG